MSLRQVAMVGGVLSACITLAAHRGSASDWSDPVTGPTTNELALFTARRLEAWSPVVPDSLLTRVLTPSERRSPFRSATRSQVEGNPYVVVQRAGARLGLNYLFRKVNLRSTVGFVDVPYSGFWRKVVGLMTGGGNQGSVPREHRRRSLPRSRQFEVLFPSGKSVVGVVAQIAATSQPPYLTLAVRKRDVVPLFAPWPRGTRIVWEQVRWVRGGPFPDGDGDLGVTSDSVPSSRAESAAEDDDDRPFGDAFKDF